jgi:hypothetical protein
MDDEIALANIIHFCFKHEVYVKTEIVDKHYLRLCVHTPEGVKKGTERYNPNYKMDQKRMKQKTDELYEYFYRKIKETIKKNEQIVDT